MATLPKASFYCKPRQTGRYLNIRLVGNSMILTLCEVEVYSESRGVIHLNLKFRFHFCFHFRLTMTFELSILGSKNSLLQCIHFIKTLNLKLIYGYVQGLVLQSKSWVTFC